jgi:ATP-dependent RNA helicase SUPV3L1/SUV3
LRRLKQKEALLAEVNDKGEVTVEGEFVGRLEGFRFRQDRDATAQEAKTIRQASVAALVPHFNLRADRFYNAPDTEIDYTEQGGLMWGDQAVGKLVAGADPLKPQVTAFVDDEAGPDVAQKVQRRLQHFIDRKIASLFEPLLALSRDEALGGLARGFAFRMVENMGILPRASVTEEVKALDQDARGALRKHGIRFGQFTVFMPLLLKPAPTRLRLVLWSLARGLDEFPESPPPGLVTVPTVKDGHPEFHIMSGYRAAGERAIRIDMLERLADMLRGEDSRSGFEAKADMLSITGMTLEQFADLMEGLGYKAERGERAKAKPADATKTAETAAPQSASEQSAPAPAEDAAPTGADAPEVDAPEAAPIEAAADQATTETPAETTTEATPEPAPQSAAEVSAEVTAGTTSEQSPPPAELEVFYTFTWGRKPPSQQGRPARGRQGQQQGQQQGDQTAKPQSEGEARNDRPDRGGKPRGKGKPRGDAPNRGDGKDRGKPRGRDQDRQPQGAKTYEARPPAPRTGSTRITPSPQP